MKEKLTEYFKPMLCSEGEEEDLGKNEYACELKTDGTLGVVERTKERFELYGRRGLTYTKTISEISEQLMKIPMLFRMVGEIVYIDPQGKMVFSASQKRCQVTDPKKVEKYKKLYPLGYFVFELVMLNGMDLTGYPYIKRKALLTDFIQLNKKLYGLGNIRLIPTVYKAEQHRQFYKEAVERGYEGVVLKRMDGKYESGKRSSNYKKLKVRDHTPFVLSNNGKVY